MVREMKRALDILKSGDQQGYRKVYDATCEEAYCRSFLIIQKETVAVDFMKEFYVELFGALDEADDAQDLERWFWETYYKKLRKQYHKLLETQEKAAPGMKTLAEIPSALPLLHRVMLVMAYKDDFTASEIGVIFGLPREKVEAELEKLDKYIPALTKNQPESVSGYLANWKVLLLGASRQITSTDSEDWVEQLYKDVAVKAGIAVNAPKADTFEYFIADVDVAPSQPKKEAPPAEEPKAVFAEAAYDEEEYDEDEYDEDEYDEDEDDDDDDRYDWDLEDDGRKMIILGVILAVVVVLVCGIIGFKLLNKNDGPKKQQVEQEVEDQDAELIIKGDAPGEEETEPVPTEPVEEEDPVEEEPVEEEPEVMLMIVNGNSVNVRSEANTNCSVVTKVNEDEEVEILSDPSQEWVKIRCVEQDNKEGYVKSEFLDSIE